MILNLFINGIDAMNKTSDGRRELVVALERRTQWVLVAVRDSGRG